MKVILLGICFLLLASIANAAYFNDKKFNIYYDYLPAQNGGPTVVLINGLTYTTENWEAFANQLKLRSKNIGILKIDLIGMGKSLLANKLPANYFITPANQTETIYALLKHLNLEPVYVIGLSYGGAIAIDFSNSYPNLVLATIAMAPFTEPVKEQDEWILSQVHLAKVSNPWINLTDDELYDYFLHKFIYATYPVSEPSTLENPYKLEGIFRLVQGIRKYRTIEHTSNLKPGSVHLMVANQDQLVSPVALDRFWHLIPKSKRGSKINISYAEHKIPEGIPLFSSGWVSEILAGNKDINNGKEFSGSTFLGTATSGNITIEVNK